MGVDIAAAFLAGGWAASLVEPRVEGHALAKSRLDHSLSMLGGGSRAASFFDSMAKVSFASISHGLVIEAVPESLPLKQRVFAELSERVPGHIPLCSNSSAIPIGEIGRGLAASPRMVGTHFFMPAHLVPGVEVVSSSQSNPAIAERVARGEAPLFQSHMWDGSAVPLDENLSIAQELLEKCIAAKIILEIEVGVVGGEEDGVENAINDKLYSTPEDAIATAKALGYGERGYYMTALTFGNVHGVYKPGNVKLRPEILKTAQEAVVAKLGLAAGSKPFDLVFHGGSGSSPEEIGAAVDYGVIKMNVDTDTQYAFTRPVAGHMLANYDGVLKVDGEVGNKKVYDPRAWGKAAEAGMAARVVEACENLRSSGQKIG